MSANAIHPYPAYRPSGVPWLGDVPAHWGVGRLKAHLLINDSGVWGENFDEQGTIVLRSTEQTIDGGWRISNPAKIRLSQEERDSALLEVNDLLVTKSSGSSAHIGKTTIVTSSIAAMNCCFSNFIQRIRLNSHVNPLLMWYILNSNVGRKQLAVKSTTTTGLGNLNGKIIGACYVPFPPLPEPAAIVCYLDRVDRRIRRYVTAKRKLIALLEEEKQAIINRAVTRGLDPSTPLKPSGVEWLGDVPSHWEVRRAKYFYREVDVRSTTGAEELMSVSHKTGVTTRKRHVTMFLAESNVGYKLCAPGDIVINTMWAYMASLGVAGQDGLVSPSYGVYRPLNHEHIDHAYIDSLLRTEAYRANYTIRSTGITSSRLRLYPESFLDILLLCPPRTEQSAVVEYIGQATADISAGIVRAGRQIELVQEYRTRLIADVVTGKLDVREAAQFVEEDDEIDPIDEGAIMLDNMDGGSFDETQPSEEELAIESEVRA